MDSRTEEILKAFPGLRYDSGFRITSPEDADYNCICHASPYTIQGRLYGQVVCILRRKKQEAITAFFMGL